MNKIVYLFLDDERLPNWKNIMKDNFYTADYTVKRSYKDAVSFVKNNIYEGDTIFIDLDHDLGNKKTGYDFCKWLIENGYKGYFHLHSMNPVGLKNMRQLLTHYGWKEF